MKSLFWLRQPFAIATGGCAIGVGASSWFWHSKTKIQEPSHQYFYVKKNEPCDAKDVIDKNAPKPVDWIRPPAGAWHRGTLAMKEAEKIPEIRILWTKTKQELDDKLKDGRDLAHGNAIQLMRHPTDEKYLVLEGNHRTSFLTRNKGMHEELKKDQTWHIFIVVASSEDEFAKWSKWTNSMEINDASQMNNMLLLNERVN